MAVLVMAPEYKAFFLSKIKNNHTWYSIFFLFKENSIIFAEHMAE